MFAVKIVDKSGLTLINNPTRVCFSNERQYDRFHKPGFITIYYGNEQPCLIYQEKTQTPLDVIYANIEKAFEENRMVTICLDS